MAFEVRFEPKHGVVVQRHWGKFDLHQAFEGGVQATRLGLENHCSRFLVDTRGIANELATPEIIDLGRGLDHMGFPPDTRLAVVYSRPFEAHHLFFEHVAESQLQVRAFTDEGEALSWLASADPSRPAD